MAADLEAQNDSEIAKGCKGKLKRSSRKKSNPAKSCLTRHGPSAEILTDCMNASSSPHQCKADKYNTQKDLRDQIKTT